MIAIARSRDFAFGAPLSTAREATRFARAPFFRSHAGVHKACGGI
ncbi:hypothetical protein BURKHO8Y_10134 [Burkholderia sp. 8Y]|nr:hypothetical protein BURKHO8Y_10134 [Burkholderia sp. 8Y]